MNYHFGVIFLMIHTVMDFGVNIFGKAALLFLIEGSRFLEFTVLSEISI